MSAAVATIPNPIKDKGDDEDLEVEDGDWQVSTCYDSSRTFPVLIHAPQVWSFCPTANSAHGMG